jgi:hypothetical protein
LSGNRILLLIRFGPKGADVVQVFDYQVALHERSSWLIRDDPTAGAVPVKHPLLQKRTCGMKTL